MFVRSTPPHRPSFFLLPCMLAALLVLLTATPSTAETPGLQAGADIDTGSKLIFVAYGDTRPNRWPFGKQSKHQDIAKAIRSYDGHTGGEVDAVLITGDLIFADVPFTSKDWKPAWKALARLRSGDHPLAVYPTLGNHELLAMKQLEAGPLATAGIRTLAEEILRWGADDAALAQSPLQPILLTQMTHLAELHPHLASLLPQGADRAYLRQLWIQMSDDVVNRLSAGEREELEQTRHDARVMLNSAARKKTKPQELARGLTALPGRIVLEALKAVHDEVDAAEKPVSDLAQAALDHITDVTTTEYASLKGQLGPVLDHLLALQALAREAGPLHGSRWLKELAENPTAAPQKSWRIFKKNLLDKLGSYLKDTTSLAGLPINTRSFTGPSWYYTDLRIPGTDTSVRFIACNSNLASMVEPGELALDLDQRAFLVEAIKSHDGPVVLFEHHPPVSVGSHGGQFNKSGDLISGFRELLYESVFSELSPAEQSRIWAIIGGHDHDYQRVVDAGRGTAIVVSGGGGVPLRDSHMNPEQGSKYLTQVEAQMGTTLQKEFVWSKAYGFVACEVTADRMEFRVYGLCEPADETLDDPEFTRLLPESLQAQLGDSSKLVDRFVIRQGEGGQRTVESLPTAGCP